MESLANFVGIAALAVSTIAASVSVWRMAGHSDKSHSHEITKSDAQKSSTLIG